jgi:signal transduction histidine kinase
MLNLGLISNEIDALMGEAEGLLPLGERRERLQSIREMVFTQCRLGLYIVRNFLSHTSETRYREVVKPQFKSVNLVKLLAETIMLHQLHAAEKLVEIENDIRELPTISGFDMELRRLFSNVINNAIKYSYHSIPNVRRVIKVRSKVPYDRRPGHTRFAVTFENYGIGLTEDERRKIFKPGFRGKQAIKEVPIGSGIGLSEAEKIMRLHKGFIKLQSKELYKDGEGVATYLTTVDLVFPYMPGRELE